MLTSNKQQTTNNKKRTAFDRMLGCSHQTNKQTIDNQEIPCHMMHQQKFKSLKGPSRSWGPDKLLVNIKVALIYYWL